MKLNPEVLVPEVVPAVDPNTEAKLDRSGEKSVTDTVVPSSAEEDTIREVESNLLALERTIDRTSATSGSVLRKALSKQAADRRNQLNSLRKSVITSTPDPSILDRNPSAFFGSQEDLIIETVPEPEKDKNNPPFQILSRPRGHKSSSSKTTFETNSCCSNSIYS